MKKSIAVISSLVLIASQSALAGNRPGAFTITPGVGYLYFDDKRPFDNAGIANLALAYDFTHTWAIEGLWGPINTRFSNRRHNHVRGDLYSIDGIYRFGTYYTHFEPYVEAGMGVFYFNKNRHEANSQANINAGLGTQVFFDNNIALRAEVRDLYTFVGGKNDAMINFGVSFLFGGNPPPAPVYKGEMMKGEG